MYPYLLRTLVSISIVTSLAHADPQKEVVEPTKEESRECEIPQIFTDLEFFPILAYRQEYFRWNIAGPNKSPNIISELKWKNIQIAEVGGGAIFVYDSRVRFQGEFKFGKIRHGKSRDSDYDGNNRTELDSRSYTDVSGSTLSANPEVGYIFRPTKCLEVIPTTGFAYYHSFFGNKNLKQVFGDIEEGEAIAGGLASSYKAKRYGPWIGARAFYTVRPKWVIYGNLQAQLAFFNGIGNWLLRPDLTKNAIRQKGTGLGLLGAVGASYALTDKWKVGFDITGDWFRLRKGDDERRFTTTVVLARRKLLNEVKWMSAGVLLRVTYRT